MKCTCACHDFTKGVVMHIVPCCDPIKETLKYRRGFADGKQGHPPAEVSEYYLFGYKDGLDVRRD